jgi:hypothetical protein
VHGYFRGAALRQLGLCIGPCQLIFLRLSMASSMHLFGNSFFAFERVKRPGGSQEALDGKKSSVPMNVPFVQAPFFFVLTQ